MPAFTPGVSLHDRYLLEQRIGSGGMAQVWRAHDRVLNRPVAVKTLTGQAAADPGLRAGARREAQAAAKLAHPNITAVHDYAEVTWPDGSVTPYLVMELLRGETLADRLARGPVPWAQAATIGAQIAAALAAAHAQGVVHQDVKPANIMLTPSGVKVLDFGIAGITGRRDDSGWIIGTPAYSPPERLRQAPPDPSADVYGLGAILCEMATGRRPWPIDTWEQAQRLHEQRFVAPDLPPSVKPPLAGAIQAALDPSPPHRPSAAALARMLDQHRFAVPLNRDALSERTTLSPAPTLIAPVGGPISGAAAVPAAHHTQRYEPVPEPPKGRSPGLIAVAALAALVVLAGGAFLLSGLFGDDPTGTGGQPAVPSAPASPSSAPSPSAAPKGVPVLIDDLRQRIDEGIEDRAIDRGEGRDLSKRVDELARRWRQEDDDFTEKCRDLQDKIDNWLEEEKIDQPFARDLDDLLDQIIDQARAAD